MQATSTDNPKLSVQSADNSLASSTTLHSESHRPLVEVGSIPGSLVKHEFACESTVRLITFQKGMHDDCLLETHADIRDKLGLAAYTPCERNDSDSIVAASSRLHRTENGIAPAQSHVHGISWLNIDGLADIDLLKAVGKKFGLHALALEDVVNVHQRAKTDVYDTDIFVVARMPVSSAPLITEQISIFIIKDRLITLQERPGDCLNPVRKRLENGKGRIRNQGSDYLAYAILDAIIDAYFPLLEQYDQTLCQIYDEISDDLSQEIPRRLHDVRSDLLRIRKVAQQHETAISELVREGSPLVTETTQPYLRDCLDHLRRLIETADTYRETCGELRELYFAYLGQRTNDSMKVLSIIATVFIPMSLIAGIYGMNFDSEVSPLNMPELHWAFGYPFAILIMLCTGGGLLLFLKRRGWL